LSAVLGGAQSLHCNGRDEALGLPTEEAARLALRTQQIIAYETGVPATIDPVGGAWAVEARTAAIEAEARTLIDRIDAAGGAIAAIESGMIQRQIQEAAYRHQQAVETGQARIVGVNYLTDDRPQIIPVFTIEPRIEAALACRAEFGKFEGAQFEGSTARQICRAARRFGHRCPSCVRGMPRHRWRLRQPA
jgi:methylmalonyl-CoA mutase N-terminal domain/subunit